MSSGSVGLEFRARLIRLIAWAGIAALVATGLLDIAAGTLDLPLGVVRALGLLACAAMLLALRRGRVVLAGHLLIGAIYGVITAGAALAGGLVAPNYVWYAVGVVVAGWLGGARAMAATAGGVLLAVLGLDALEAAGALPPRTSFTMLRIGGGSLLALLACAAAAWTAQREMRRRIEEVRESERRFEDFARASGDWFWETDAEGRFTWLSDSFEARTGAAVAAFLGRTRAQMAAPSQDLAAEPWKSHLEALARREPFRDFRYLRATPAGEQWMSTSGVPRFGADGAVLGYRGASTVVTERVRAEQAARAARQMFESVFEKSPSAISLYTEPEGRIVSCNAAYERLFARPRAEIIGRTGRELGLWQDWSDRERLHAQRRQDGSVRDFEADLVAADGRRFTALVGADTIVIDGQPLVLAQTIDITARKATERALRESEARFRGLTELSTDWYWEQDAALRFTRFSGGQMHAKWGGDQTLNLGLLRWEIPGLAPLSCSWDEHRATLEARQPFRDFEYSRTLADGSRRFVSTNGAPIFDADGRFAGYRGTATDITERKQAESRAALEHRVVQALAEAPDTRTGLRAALRELCEAEGWDCGQFYEADDAAGVLRQVEGWGVDEPGVQRFLEASSQYAPARGVGLRGLAWATGEVLWVEDVNADPRTSPAGRAISGDMTSAVVFPVTLQGRAIGAADLSTRQPRTPDASLLRTLASIGSQMGQFVKRMRSEEAQRRFRAGMDASADMILLIDPRRMRYVDVNEAVCRTLGYSREEMLAMGPQDVLGEPREALQRAYLSFVSDPGSVQGMQGAYRCKDGSRVPFESTRRVLATEDGALIVAISRDVRERLESERALRESEARFAAIFHESLVPQLVSDPEARAIEDVNNAFCALSGYPRDELLGRGGDAIGLFWSEADLETIAAASRTDGTRGAVEIGLRRRDGVRRTAMVTGFPLETAGARRMAWTLIDVTEQRDAQRLILEMNESLERTVAWRTEELSRANDDLKGALEELQRSQEALLGAEKLAALGRLVAGVAHELNTPIGNSLLSATTLAEHAEAFARAAAEPGLRRSVLAAFVEQSREAAGILVRNLDKAGQLISSFKQLAADQTSSQRRSFALDEIVRELLLAYQPMLKKSRIEVRADVPAGIRMDSYPGPLGQVLGNLLSNAVLHGYEGCDDGVIEISARRDHPELVEIAVIDHGRGMSEADLGHIFEPFFTTKMGRGGTGLGMTLCHSIVTGALGGTIRGLSRPGQGATFVVRIPLQAPVAPAQRAA